MEEMTQESRVVRLSGLELAVVDYLCFDGQLIHTLLRSDSDLAGGLHQVTDHRPRVRIVNERWDAIRRLVSLGIVEYDVTLRAGDLSSEESLKEFIRAFKLGRTSDRSHVGAVRLSTVGRKLWQSYAQPIWERWGTVANCWLESWLQLPTDFESEVVVCGGSFAAREYWVEMFFCHMQGGSVWGVQRLGSGESLGVALFDEYKLPAVHWVRYGINRPPCGYGETLFWQSRAAERKVRYGNLLKRPEAKWCERGFDERAVIREASLDFSMEFRFPDMTVE